MARSSSGGDGKGASIALRSHAVGRKLTRPNDRICRDELARIAADECAHRIARQYVAVRRFYVHGAGRAGREAWPEQPGEGAVFADHSACPQMRRKADLVGEQCPDGDVVVIAHSLGAVPAALAFAAGDISASHMVLLEPALYDIARGEDAIERHVIPVTEALERAGRGDLFGYWQIVGPLMFGRKTTRESWQDDHDLAQRFADIDPPWGYEIEASVFAEIPTIVVTGGWKDEYEAIAKRLTHAGATHVRLSGAKHRPQDHPGFESILADFLGLAHRSISRKQRQIALRIAAGPDVGVHKVGPGHPGR